MIHYPWNGVMVKTQETWTRLLAPPRDVGSTSLKRIANCPA